ncbi:unnamed protein product [Caenorhabditis auriculariae]|uniref:ACB domain-containing protein n=1 Tax=Caenorhabditis auriculariae TaxID=2777116 RepID=A0A8S1HKA6_9PELO|nr:unnamed protein product [Caenorhabditis auriculariae]
MPISELEKKWTGMNFDIAAEEMRRLKEKPTERERLHLYGLYKQSLHGDIPTEEFYPVPPGDFDRKKYAAWRAQKGKKMERAREEYLKLSEDMIKEIWKKKIVRSKWNSEVWSVDY